MRLSISAVILSLLFSPGLADARLPSLAECVHYFSFFSYQRKLKSLEREDLPSLKNYLKSVPWDQDIVIRKKNGDHHRYKIRKVRQDHVETDFGKILLTDIDIEKTFAGARIESHPLYHVHSVSVPLREVNSDDLTATIKTDGFELVNGLPPIDKISEQELLDTLIKQFGEGNSISVSPGPDGKWYYSKNRSLNEGSRLTELPPELVTYMNARVDFLNRRFEADGFEASATIEIRIGRGSGQASQFRSFHSDGGTLNMVESLNRDLIHGTYQVGRDGRAFAVPNGTALMVGGNEAELGAIGLHSSPPEDANRIFFRYSVQKRRTPAPAPQSQ